MVSDIIFFNIFLAKTCFTVVIIGIVIPLSNGAFVILFAICFVIQGPEINMFVKVLTRFHI